MQINISTSAACQMVNITREVQTAVSKAGISDGICFVHVLHTTAGITINENADPDVVHDILLSLENIVKELPDFRHFEGNSTAHIKASLMGNSVSVPVTGGKLQLGVWQGIYFCEFDGPRKRKAYVTCVANKPIIQ